MRVDGTRVWLDLPDGFVAAEKFPGFIHYEPQASITVAELPSSFVESHDLYTRERLARKGVELLHREGFEKDGLRANFIEARQMLGNQETTKLLLVTGDVGESVVVTATYYSRDAATHREALIRAVRNVVWQPSLPLDLFDGLGFRLKDVPGLRVATRASNSIIFTDSGALPDPFYTGLFLVAGWSEGELAEGEDAQVFSREQFRLMGMVNTGIIDNVETSRIDGREAIETTGHGVHRHLGYEVSVYQALVIYPDRYFVAQGIADRGDAKTAFDRFRSVIGTLDGALPESK